MKGILAWWQVWDLWHMEANFKYFETKKLQMEWDAVWVIEWWYKWILIWWQLRLWAEQRRLAVMSKPSSSKQSWRSHCTSNSGRESVSEPLGLVQNAQSNPIQKVSMRRKWRPTNKVKRQWMAKLKTNTGDGFQFKSNFKWNWNKQWTSVISPQV